MDTRSEQNDFLDLISANMGIIRKICYSYCFSENDRQDLAQEIIFVLWKGSKKYDIDRKFPTWMYRVALNVAISYYRNSKKTIDTIPVREPHLEIEDQPSESSQAETDYNLLQGHISTLKELDKALIILYFEEKSYSEIAEIVGISETNVATKVSRIKEKLKQAILSAKK